MPCLDHKAEHSLCSLPRFPGPVQYVGWLLQLGDSMRWCQQDRVFRDRNLQQVGWGGSVEHWPSIYEPWAYPTLRKRQTLPTIRFPVAARRDKNNLRICTLVKIKKMDV